MSLNDIFKAIIKRWYILLSFVIIFALGGFIISEFAMEKKYESSARVYVYVEADTNADNSKLMTEKTATTICMEQKSSRTLFVNLSETLNKKGIGDFDYRKLNQSIEFTLVNKDINIIDFNCRWTDSDTAQKILVEFLDVFKTTMKGMPYTNQFINVVTQEHPSFDEDAVSPNVMLNCLLATLIGAIIAIIVIIIMLSNDDRKLVNIKDISKKFEVVVLGEIPDIERVASEKCAGGEDNG